MCVHARAKWNVASAESEGDVGVSFEGKLELQHPNKEENAGDQIVVVWSGPLDVRKMMRIRTYGIFHPGMFIDQSQRARLSIRNFMCLCVRHASVGGNHIRPCTPTPLPSHAVARPCFLLLPMLIVPRTYSYAVRMCGMDTMSFDQRAGVGLGYTRERIPSPAL
jgi:hypothetical protein